MIYRRAKSTLSCFLATGMLLTASASVAAEEVLAPLPNAQWDATKARHLLLRTGFDPRPAEVAMLAAMSREDAVNHVLGTATADPSPEPPFQPSGAFKPDLDPFPPSRPATTKLAATTGKALGIEVKPSGNRPAQAIVNEFFYWLRASYLETDRLSYWWANTMLRSEQPLRERMALFWHGHFATSEDKVRDYRKMAQQLALFRSKGLGNFRDLLIGVAQNPAMLAYLDAGVNVKGSPNENFAREIMELFTMGVGHYSEQDVREAARAFTGWNFEGLSFVVNTVQHDDDAKTFLGHTDTFDGVDIIDLILQQDATADFIASKLYRHFVSEQLPDGVARELGTALKAANYELTPFLGQVFNSTAFYQSAGTRIKPPVELVIGTYRQLELERVPGIPDFNQATAELGQRLMHPPTVAGWSGGRSWITPGLLFERGNFILDVLFPDIGFVPPDRYPQRTPHIIAVHERIRAGMDITNATRPVDMSEGNAGMMAASNLLADRDEDFNTRYGSYRGWQMAIENVEPIPRHTARLNLSAQVVAAGLRTSREVVDWYVARFFTVAPSADRLDELTRFLTEALGTTQIARAQSYMEEPLRQLLHLLLSQPEYQLG